MQLVEIHKYLIAKKIKIFCRVKILPVIAINAIPNPNIVELLSLTNANKAPIPSAPRNVNSAKVINESATFTQSKRFHRFEVYFIF